MLAVAEIADVREAHLIAHGADAVLRSIAVFAIVAPAARPTVRLGRGMHKNTMHTNKEQVQVEMKQTKEWIPDPQSFDDLGTYTVAVHRPVPVVLPLVPVAILILHLPPLQL